MELAESRPPLTLEEKNKKIFLALDYQSPLEYLSFDLVNGYFVDIQQFPIKRNEIKKRALYSRVGNLNIITSFLGKDNIEGIVQIPNADINLRHTISNTQFEHVNSPDKLEIRHLERIKEKLCLRRESLEDLALNCYIEILRAIKSTEFSNAAYKHNFV